MDDFDQELDDYDFDPALDALFGDLDPEERAYWEHVWYRDEPIRPWIERVTNDRPARRTKMVQRLSQDRLQRLFDAFAVRLWPGQLTGWRVETRYFTEAAQCLACCSNDRERRVSVDLTRLHSDRQVRNVLLHEMCHATTPASSCHDLLFFQQVERLLALGLRPAVDFAVFLNEPDGEVVRATLPRCAALRHRCERRLGIVTQRLFPEFIGVSPCTSRERPYTMTLRGNDPRT